MAEHAKNAHGKGAEAVEAARVITEREGMAMEDFNSRWVGLAVAYVTYYDQLCNNHLLNFALMSHFVRLI